MPNEFQSALAEAIPVLKEGHGEVFVLGSGSFTAWRVQEFTVKPGRLDSAPTSTNLYEAVRADAPTVENNSLLVDVVGAKRRAENVQKVDPSTGLFRFRA